MDTRPVYLDYQATTPLDPRVKEVVLRSFETYGNPHGRQHEYGREAADAVNTARQQVAGLVGAYPNRILFTSGATESCNLALRGAAIAANGQRRRIITLATEHAAVLQTVYALGRSGLEAVILPVETDGLVNLDRIEETVDDNTLIVSVMAVNNEIGVIQPLADIASICHRHGALLHTDATQAPARIAIDVDAWGADFLSMSAHKLYGPKGVGALYLRDDATLTPLLTGGGQERGFRPGTVPTPLICGFGEAAELALDELQSDAERMVTLASKLREGIDTLGVEVHQFGSWCRRAPGTLSFGFKGLSGDKLVALVEKRIAISTGATCSSESASVSHVLTALGYGYSDAATAVRASLGRFTSVAEVDIAIQALARVAEGMAA